MPTCARCGKVQASAELTRRRLHGAYTCKDQDACAVRAVRQARLREEADANRDRTLTVNRADAQAARGAAGQA